MEIGDRVSIKQKVFMPYDTEPVKEQIVQATVIHVEYPSSFIVKYDQPQEGYEHRAFPFHAIPTIVQILKTKRSKNMNISEIDLSNYEIEHIPQAHETPRQLLMQMYEGQEFEYLKHPSGRDFTWQEMRETQGAIDLIMGMVKRSTWVGIRLREK